MQVNVKRLHHAAIIPKRATPGAACFDLAALDEGALHPLDQWALIYRTGLAFEVPAGHVMLVFSRSGQGFRDGVRLSNCVGVIDSDYRGEVQVSLRYDAGAAYRPKRGDRIAQAMILPIPAVELIEADELTDTARGAGGFGSTGNT